jgi:hypothetical protein
MPHLTPQECHEDFTAIGSAIVNLAQVLTGRYDSTVLSPQGDKTVTCIEPLANMFDNVRRHCAKQIAQGKITGDPTVRAWNRVKGNFLEGLALLSSLHGSESTSKQRTKLRLFGSNAKLPIVKNGDHMFLWTQHRVSDTHSGLNARPDITYTNAPDIRPDTVVSIRECKHGGVGAKTIRSEFGKAYDLRVASYIIVSYYPLSDRLRIAASRFGLDVEALELHTDHRGAVISGSEDLGMDLAQKMARAEERATFAERLRESAFEAEDKTRGGSRRPE